MCLESIQKKQAGAGLPIAIFIVTVLSLIVLGMSQLQESSDNATSLQIQSQRAFFAAESGAQVAMAEVFDAGNCSGGTIGFTAGGLSSCKATITGCSAGDIVSSGAGDFYRIQSVGICSEGSREEARRTVEVMLSVD